MKHTIRPSSLAMLPRNVLLTGQWQGYLARAVTRGGTLSIASSTSATQPVVATGPASSAVAYIEETWDSNEEFLNEAISAILMAAAPEVLGDLMRGILPGTGLGDRACVAEIEWQPWRRDLAAVVGHPDICLASPDGERVCLVELKVNAKKTNGKFTVHQMLKYEAHRQVLEVAGRRTWAVLLVPSTTDFVRWTPAKDRAWLSSQDGLVRMMWRESGPAPTNRLRAETAGEFRLAVTTRAARVGLRLRPEDARPLIVVGLDHIERALADDPRSRHLAPMFAEVVARASALSMRSPVSGSPEAERG